MIDDRYIRDLLLLVPSDGFLLYVRSEKWSQRHTTILEWIHSFDTNIKNTIKFLCEPRIRKAEFDFTEIGDL